MRTALFYQSSCKTLCFSYGECQCLTIEAIECAHSDGDTCLSRFKTSRKIVATSFWASLEICFADTMALWLSGTGGFCSRISYERKGVDHVIAACLLFRLHTYPCVMAMERKAFAWLAALLPPYCPAADAIAKSDGTAGAVMCRYGSVVPAKDMPDGAVPRRRGLGRAVLLGLRARVP